MDSKKEIQQQKIWSGLGYSQKFLNALRGIYVFWKITKTRDLLVYIVATIVAVFLGFYFSISSYEWIAIIFSIGFVIVSEAFNTAIEIDIDLTSPEYHPYARDTKDVAAAAALFSVFTAVIVGLIIFLPKFF